MGNPNTPEGLVLLKERSPLYKAGDIVRPLLIGQGANDPRVNQAESDQIVEAMPLADIAKLPVALGWTLAQVFPADNTEAGLPVADKIVNNFISAVSVQAGAVHITFGNRANGNIRGKVLSLRPATVEDAPIVPVTWVCGYAAPPAKMTVKGENKTTIAANFLPFICRAPG